MNYNPAVPQMRKFNIYMLAMVFAIAMISCSAGSDPVSAPSDVQDNQYNFADLNPDGTHMVLDVAEVYFDPVTNDIEIVPLRTTEAHLNLTSFINNPGCPNSSCLTWYVTSYDATERIWYLDLVLTNPTNQEAYDLRIIFEEMPGEEDGLPNDGLEWQVVNPDSYTTNFDGDPEFDEDEKWLNPFIAFEKEDADRHFEGGAGTYSDVEELQIHIPEGAPGGSITIIIDASFPGHCYEPYQIIKMDQLDVIPKDTLPGDGTVEIVLGDWQLETDPADVSSVSLYIPDIIDGDGFIEMSEVAGWPPPIDLDDPPLSQEEIEFLEEYGFYNPETLRMYTVDIENELDVIAGMYDVIVRAESTDYDGDGFDKMYHRFQVEVAQGGNGGPGPGNNLQIVFSSYVIDDAFSHSDIWTHWFDDGQNYPLLNSIVLSGQYSEELEPSISTDGDTVVFISNYNQIAGVFGPFNVYSLDVDEIGHTPRNYNTGFVRQLTNVASNPNLNGDCRTPDISPDSDYVAFSAYGTNNFDIYTVLEATPSGTLSRITTHLGDDEAPHFDKSIPSALGSYGLYFHSNRAGAENYEIYWIDPSSQESSFNRPVRLTFDNGFDGFPTSRYDDTAVAWHSDRYGFPEIMMFDGIDQVVRLTENDDTDLFPSFSPDGLQIAFMSDRYDFQFEILSINTDGGNQARYTFNDTPDLDPAYGGNP